MHSAISPDAFSALIAPLGPFEPCPRVAAAVSGGADSLALAMLAAAWARARNGTLLALVVDHTLRPDSAAEAALTIDRLAGIGIPARLLRLSGLTRGPALAERARAARYAVLTAACAEAGILHLLLGHHAGDQAETVLMRRQGGSGPAGLAAMPAVSEQTSVRLLRPLLSVPPARLKATLRAAGIAWVEDPSNRDPRALRSRLRAALNDPDGAGAETAALCQAARDAGLARVARDTGVAHRLAAGAEIHPEGFALLPPGPMDADGLAALVQMVSGAAYPPPPRQVAALAAEPRPATLAGAQLMPAGRLGADWRMMRAGRLGADRLGAGWLLVREAAVVGPPVAARPGAVWDGRFRLTTDAAPPAGATIGALGRDAARLRRHSPLPATVLQTLPALRLGNCLAAVPHLLYPDPSACAAAKLVFSPRRPAAGAPFSPSRETERAKVH